MGISWLNIKVYGLHLHPNYLIQQNTFHNSFDLKTVTQFKKKSDANLNRMSLIKWALPINPVSPTKILNKYFTFF